MCTALWQAAKTSTLLWQRKQAQRCDSNGANSNVTALTVTALGHQWLWHRCDSDVCISVTVMQMATDTAVTAVTTDSGASVVAADTAVTAMYTLMWQHCQLLLLSQWCAHRCHNNVHIAVTLVCTVIIVTLMWTLLSQQCQLTPLSQHCQCHRCHSTISCHCCHTSVHSSVTALPLSPLLHCCQFTSMTH